MLKREEISNIFSGGLRPPKYSLERHEPLYRRTRPITGYASSANLVRSAFYSNSSFFEVENSPVSKNSGAGFISSSVDPVLLAKMKSSMQSADVPIAHPKHLSDLVEHLIPRILEAIETSKNILALKDDWDGEGSIEYLTSTWDRAIEFLKRNALSLRLHYDKEIQAPKIYPGPEGSIDLHWKTDSHELLVNIPADLKESADFYGDCGLKSKIKGKLDTSANNEWILMWLTN